MLRTLFYGDIFPYRDGTCFVSHFACGLVMIYSTSSIPHGRQAVVFLHSTENLQTKSRLASRFLCKFWWRWGESNPRAKRNSRYFIQTYSVYFLFELEKFETDKIFASRVSFILKIRQNAHIFYPEVYYTDIFLTGFRIYQCRIYAKANSGAKEKYGETIPFTLEDKFALILFSCTR